MDWLWVVICVIVFLFVVMLFWKGFKLAIYVAVNSILGFFALYAVQAFWLGTLVINLWSVLLTAIFGIFGLILVVILHLLNAAF
jgi:hypothetical protein